MKRLRLVGLGVLVVAASAGGADEPKKERKEPLKALQEVHDLVGSWRCTGEPNGTREEKLKGFWTEKVSWRFSFKKADDVHLIANYEKGKYFTRGELRYLPADDAYQYKVVTTDKETLVFQGKLDKTRLALERVDPKTKQAQRLVFSLLHFNRYLTLYEVKKAGHTAYSPVYKVGCTKEGVAFAADDDKPECVVSGGLGTTPMTYKGTTYYVCCTGCRDAFKENPEKYVKEFEAKKKAKKKE